MLLCIVFVIWSCQLISSQGSFCKHALRHRHIVFLNDPWKYYGWGLCPISLSKQGVCLPVIFYKWPIIFCFIRPMIHSHRFSNRTPSSAITSILSVLSAIYVYILIQAVCVNKFTTIVNILFHIFQSQLLKKSYLNTKQNKERNKQTNKQNPM